MTKRCAALFAAVTVLLTAACGSNSSSPPASTGASSGTGSPLASASASLSSAAASHRATLAPEESLDLAYQLTPLPGYTYKDPPLSEVNKAVATVKDAMTKAGTPDLIAAQSYHSVVAADASQNTSRSSTGAPEVGFLQFNAFGQAPPASLATSPELFSKMQGGQPLTSFTASGTTVYVFDSAGQPNSRYAYMWLRHGIMAHLDGATRAPLERWVRRYLAVPAKSEGETTQLALRLLPVPGYMYVNFPDPDAVQSATAVFGAAPYSTHELVTDNGAFGWLTLASVPAGTTTADVAGKYQSAYSDLTAATTTTIAGVPVATFKSGDSTLHLWATHGVAGSVAGGDAAAAEQYIRGLLAGWQAHGWA